MILQTQRNVTLIGGACITKDMIAEAMCVAPMVVAADGGADQALAHGLDPIAVIGDFDSLSLAAKQRVSADRLHHIAEQDSTDFDKCLRNIKAPLIVGIGFSGGRFDHQLAACNTLCRHPEQHCIILGKDELLFLAPKNLKIDLSTGMRVSLFPMGQVSGTSKGLKWPVNGLDMRPDRRIGTSNETTGAVELSVTAPRMIVILPCACFGAAVKALEQAPHWHPE